MSEIGNPCTETQVCTLPNIYCQHPNCAFGKQQEAERQAAKHSEAIAALQPGGERKWPDTICNDIDKLLRQHIRWTQGDHSEGTYIEGWRKAARAVEEYIQKMQRAPAPVAVDDAMVNVAVANFNFVEADAGLNGLHARMRRALEAALAGEVG